MDLGSIFLIFALLVLVGLFISRPFFISSQPVAQRAPDREDHELSMLLAERDHILNALQELDFDYALNKIPDEDYPLQRNILLQRGAQVLRKLDEQQSVNPVEDVETRIEAAIAARRADAAREVVNATNGGNGRGETAGIAANPDDGLEVMLANRRRIRREKSGGFCPQCGGPLQKSDRFCHKCGARLAA